MHLNEICDGGADGGGATAARTVCQCTQYRTKHILQLNKINRQLFSSNRSQPVIRGARWSDGVNGRSSWRRHWIRGFCPTCSRRCVWCHLVRPASTILWLDHHVAIPTLVCRHRCAGPSLRTRIYSWLVPMKIHPKKIVQNFVLKSYPRNHLHDNRSDHHGHRMLRYRRQVHAINDQRVNNCSNVHKLRTHRMTLQSSKM